MCISLVRSFWWRNPKSLGDDAYIVTETRAVPQKLFIAKLLWVEGFCLAVSFNAEAVDHLQLHSTTTVGNVLLNNIVLFASPRKWGHLAV